MLLTTINELTPGMVVGAAVLHPARPELELLKPGTSLTQPMLAQLRRLDLQQVWVRADGVSDLDPITAAKLTQSQQQVYTQLKKDMAGAASRSISTASMQSYKQTIMSLVCQAVTDQPYAGLSYRLQVSDGPLFSHCASVAYLSIVVGLGLEKYIVRERPRLGYKEARDIVGLGLGGMLHDIGKVGTPQLEQMNEVALPGHRSSEYEDHPIRGFKMLADARACPAARQAVLLHHHRWNGGGWPEAETFGFAEPPSERQLHVFSRIVSAVNVLDNLLIDASGKRKPAVHALHDFASDRFQGWFDPVIRRAVLRHVPPFGVGVRVKLSDGRPCAVACPNPDDPMRPIVRPIDRRSIPPIDLALTRELSIVEAEGVDVSKFTYELPRKAA